MSQNNSRMPNFRHMAEITEEEISWFLLFADADCGMRSNWNAMVNAAVFNGGKWEDSYNDHIFEAVRQRRVIANRLQNMPPRLRNILYTSFGNQVIPATVSKYFDTPARQYAPAALHSKLIAPNDLIRLFNQFYMNQTNDEQKELLRRIKEEAMADQVLAIESYYRERKKK